MMDSTIDVYGPECICGRAVVYDFGKLNAKPGQRITAQQILALEEEMGVAAGKDDILLMNYNWFQYWTVSGDWKYYAKMSEPGGGRCPTVPRTRIRAAGSDTIACETPVIAGEEMESYAHHVHWLPNHILMIEELKNLDKLPTVCYFVATPLKIKMVPARRSAPLRWCLKTLTIARCRFYRSLCKAAFYYKGLRQKGIP